MANVKISQLPTASSLTEDDLMVIVDSGSVETQQISVGQLLQLATGSTSGSVLGTGSADQITIWQSTDTITGSSLYTIVSAYSDITALGSDDYFYVIDTGNTDSRKVTVSDLLQLATGSTSGTVQGTGSADQITIWQSTDTITGSSLYSIVSGYSAIASLGNDDQLYVIDVGNSASRNVTISDLLQLATGSTSGTVQGTGSADQLAVWQSTDTITGSSLYSIVSGYTDITALGSDDYFYVIDNGAGTSQKVTVSDLLQLATGSTSGTVQGTGSAEQVSFWESTDTLSGSGIYWDVSESRVGINKSAPSAPLHVSGGAGNDLVTLTDGATINTDASLGNVFKVTLGGNRDLANPTNLVSGFTYMWIIEQDATGGRTLSFGSSFKFSGGGTPPTLSTASGSIDIVSAVYDGTYLYCVSQLDFF